MTLLAHVSDPHLDTSPERRARLERVLAAVAGYRGVTGLVLTGDLADHGADDEYRELRAVLAASVPDLPTLLVPGNHDDREVLRRHLPGAPAEGPLDTLLDVGDVRLVGLDSTIPGQDGGGLAASTVAFARAAVAGAPGRVVLAMHHPAVAVGHAVVDGYGLADHEDLARVVRPARNVVACLAGHVHSALASTFAGRPLVCAPGVVSTLRLDDSVEPFADHAAVPGLALHAVHDDGTVTSRFHHLPPER